MLGDSVMNNIKKLLVTLIMTVLICSGFSTTAFAESTEDKTGNTSTDNSSLTTATDTTVTSETATAGLLTGDGFLVDEQGHLYVDASLLSEAGTDDINLIDNNEDTQIEDTQETDTDDNQQEDSESVEKPAYSKSELRYLSCLIYAEAGNQSYSAMLGVANVVLNRAKSDVFWHVKTVKDVIYDHKWSVQFAVTIKNSKGISPLDKALKAYDSGKFSGGNPEAEKRAMNKAIKAAKAALNGKNNIGSYLCFSNKGYKSYVKRHFTKYEIIDDLIFFRAE
jgi:spore germination cell wall hydrolase CwlJ-like protein